MSHQYGVQAWYVFLVALSMTVAVMTHSASASESKFNDISGNGAQGRQASVVLSNQLNYAFTKLAPLSSNTAKADGADILD